MKTSTSKAIMKSGVIKFNVNDTGRLHTGSARNFDCAALCALVNSPAVQERVRLRGMHGYFGHWPRMRYGLYPPEGLIDGGKVVNIEPALVTTLLRAQPDGTLEHEAEFLDTPTGHIAARMHSNRIGGFSTAILAPNKRNGADVVSEFAGFDYVAEQNVVQNRGYLLDSSSSAAQEIILDSMARDMGGSLHALHALMRHMQRDYDLQASVILALQQENEDLLSMQANGRVFDHASGHSVGVVQAVDATKQFTSSAQSFMAASLPGWQPPSQSGKTPAEKQAYDMIKERVYGFGE